MPGLGALYWYGHAWRCGPDGEEVRKITHKLSAVRARLLNWKDNSIVEEELRYDMYKEGDETGRFDTDLALLRHGARLIRDTWGVAVEEIEVGEAFDPDGDNYMLSDIYPCEEWA